jgi:excisionase family DNA binding protein
MASPTSLPDASRFLSVYEAAKVLDIERSTLYRAMRRGDLPYVTIGKRRRFRPEDLEQYLQPKSVAS